MTPNAKRVVKISILSLFFIFIILYAFFTSKDVIFGAKIKDIRLNGAPIQSGITLKESIVKVTGNAKNAIHLTLNGREISINEQGDWNETIALLSGYNIISIRAKDKFGNVDEKNYKIMYKES